jgi:hypothetical protein
MVYDVAGKRKEVILSSGHNQVEPLFLSSHLYERLRSVVDTLPV